MKHFNELNNRYVIKIPSWKLDNFSSMYKNANGKNISISIDLMSYYSINPLFAILRDIYDCKQQPSSFNFNIVMHDKLFPLKDFEVIKQFDRILRTQNAKLYIKENDVLWDISEVEKTYNYIHGIVEEIKSKNMSPLEQFLYAYKKLAQNVYNDDESLKSPTMTHSLFSLSNNGHIVCQNFAETLREIVDNLNNDNLKCFFQSVSMHDKKQKDVEMHAMNMVILKDDKYKINGMYHADVTWDSRADLESPMTLSYCLLPVSDINFYKNYTITANKNNNFKYFYENDNSMYIMSVENLNTLNVLKQQKVVDIDEERKQYADYISQNTPEDAKYVQNSPFDSVIFENRFLKHVCKKIKLKSTVIPYETLKDAFINVLILDGLKKEEAENYCDEVFEKSKGESMDNFIVGAKNAMFAKARLEFDRVMQIRKELRERSQKRKAQDIKKEGKEL